MILTVTPNPSVDRTVFVDALLRGRVIRGRRSRSEPSGKGVNVALALLGQGFGVAAVVPAGGAVGARFTAMLAEAGLTTHRIAIAGEIRSNVSLVEPDGTVTKINEPGPELTPAEVEALAGAVLDHLPGVAWLACCGSLPGGVAADFYARLAERARARGVRVAVDTSGAPLRAALAGRPDLVKPNAGELADLVGGRLRTLGDVVDAAAAVRALGAGAVLASLGADGAVLVDATGAVHAEAPVAAVASAVGAGDATLAGFLGAGGEGAAALRAAVAWGAAAVGHEGTLLAGVDPAQPVVVRSPVDRSRTLREPAG